MRTRIFTTEPSPLFSIRRRKTRPLTALWLAVAVGIATAAHAAPLVIYDDALQPGIENWSWGSTVNLAQSTVVHAGTHSVGVGANAWGAFFAHRAAGIDTAIYAELDLWLRGDGSSGQVVQVAVIAGGDPVGTPVAVTLTGAWVQQKLSFAALGLTTTDVVDGVWVQYQDGATKTFYVDDLLFIESTTPPPPPATVTVTVDPSADRRAISPAIYGVNFGDDAQAADLRWPIRRWGGNSTTRYNWRVDVHSVGVDWFYFNYTNFDPAPPNLPDGSSADLFVDSTRATGGEPIVTVPLIGWTPIGDRVRRWSFPVSVYGPQQTTECTDPNNAPWCNPDAGNGLQPNGTPLTPVPTRTSQTIGATFVTDWMTHIAARVGDAGHGGVRLFALDNEPGLWNSSHRDVHPDPTTYQELWDKTLTIATAMKAKDPNVKLLGPVSWGWCEYFFSAADPNGCSDGTDRMSHGDQPWIEWYLDQAHAYEQQHGVRLVDYLDLHYYPQNSGVALSNNESAATAAMRLRSLKSLYDPTYVDETWINTQIRMIPRMRDWVANHYPGTKLAITEYSWGNDDGASSTLAQAEALAIFGREGLDLATRWIAPGPGTRVEDAFRLYLNFNGAGGRVSGDSVRATSSDVNAVGAYAIERADKRRFFLLFNKDTNPRHTTVRLAGSASITGTANLVRFDATHRIASAGALTPTAGALELDLPARSATLLVIDAQAPPASDFYSLTPCRLLDTRSAAGPYGGPQLTAGSGRSFALAGHCGIPSDARAISVNVTAVGGTAVGVLRAYAADDPIPTTSVVSFSAGSTRANNGLVRLSADGTGSINLRAEGAAVQIVVDVNGYFR